MMRRSLFALSGRLLSSASVLAQTSRTTPAACEALQTLQVDGVVVTIAKTQWFVAGATGHTGTGAFDGSFQQDQQASLDFAYVAIGAELAKRIIAKNYGKPPAQRRSHVLSKWTPGRWAYRRRFSLTGSTIASSSASFSASPATRAGLRAVPEEYRAGSPPIELSTSSLARTCQRIRKAQLDERLPSHADALRLTVDRSE
jgi:hypothetical protein